MAIGYAEEMGTDSCVTIIRAFGIAYGSVCCGRR